ncbi:AsmA-like C-terminal region-containing protein [Flavobacterium sp. Fl-77]|uniref:AsmA-like C-terminal region-containing protein n=1 Tax=Flavobacterium flavipigmentatum TaxID=2893884 RepID=A0AAJ2VX50_9FLAO|nr:MULTISPECIES: AsmA-like C-terminal region-containing protein [unclassified Flavobacterium]MDX6181244.1 AsmA-like C-terminal region-containing protein [Flavobacterium sp. Fl-33]MDX6184845.1 AsmA-like C-terminal region-containing protein [Flavobacterium sp. Fl-77]UFH39937.1 AsmA family protein [Flavobacterium sp. F-70]
MNLTLQKIKSVLRSVRFQKYARRIAFFVVGCISLLLIACCGLSIYFNQNKTEIVAKINSKINENINGKFHVGDFQYKFLIGFPNFTLALKEVELKDNNWGSHQHTLLKAREIEARLNIWSLLQNEINIKKIYLNDAQIYIYKAENGYSNADIFKPKNKKSPENSEKETTILNEITLNHVHFTLDNRLRHKLFDFDISRLESKIAFKNDNWQTDLHLKTSITSLAFNTKLGSFAQQKKLEGTFKVAFLSKKQLINVTTQNLKIGTDRFDIIAFFNVGKNNSLFGININTHILWRNAANLLSQNINSQLNHFDLKKEIAVNCDIKGDLNSEGDPKIVVHAEIRNNTLSIPDGHITDCSFSGFFTNNFKPKKGFNDANSAIIISRFSGKFKNIPVSVPQVVISNLNKPIATGTAKSNFAIQNLNEMSNDKWIHFSNGHATANLKFHFDIVDLYITKPRFIGNIDVKNVSFLYIPKNVHAENINVQLNFTEKALFIDKITYKHNKNIIFIDGKIDDFLNLYYDAPEKMVVNWNIYAPYIDLKQFLGILASTQKSKVAKKRTNNTTLSEQLRTTIEKCTVAINIKADKITYNKLTATNTKANIRMIDSQLFIKNGSLQTSGGSITFNSVVTPSGKNYSFSSNAQVNKVAIAVFLRSFNNFGIQSFSPDNIQGKLSSQANIKGFINSKGELITNSMQGKLNFTVHQGALQNFQPIVKIGKFAFPFRDVNNITFSDLSGNLDVHGEQIQVNDLTISSNILNFDIDGIYSFGRGTNLALTIPLRNSKNDAQLPTKAERDAVRDRGIILHLLAVDDEGKIKIKWGKKEK